MIIIPYSLIPTLFNDIGDLYDSEMFKNFVNNKPKSQVSLLEYINNNVIFGSSGDRDNNKSLLEQFVNYHISEERKRKIKILLDNEL